MFEKKCVNMKLNKRKLAATTERLHQLESGLLLDVVVRQSAAIFQLLASKDKMLLVWGNAFLILYSKPSLMHQSIVVFAHPS